MSTDNKKNKKIFLILIITAYILLAGLMIYRAQQSPGTCPFLAICGSSTTNETAGSKVTTAVVKGKNKEIKLPTLLELGSTSCVPCQMMKPILEKLTKEYKGVLKVKFIDVWLKKNANIGVKYKINSIPTQIFFDAEGREIWRHTGYIPEENLLAQWKKLGYDFPALKKNKK